MLNLVQPQNQVSADELYDLQKQFGLYPCYIYDICFHQEHFEYWKDTIEKKKRRGEVALVIRNQSNQILLHTKSYYPDNTYRLLTGGIDQNEAVLMAFQREIFEETGFTATAEKLIAVLLYKFSFQNQVLTFPSFIFEIEPDNPEPHSQDEKEQITDFKWVLYSNLDKVAAHLRALEKGWRDWGHMRAIVHDIVYQWYLN